LEIWAATPTPFDADGAVDPSVVRRLADRLRAGGVDGAFVAGTTGEFPALSIAERQQLLEAWSVQRDGLRIGAHVGHTGCTSRSG
jgi:N-acetylneuraminate lyase